MVVVKLNRWIEKQSGFSNVFDANIWGLLLVAIKPLWFKDMKPVIHPIDNLICLVMLGFIKPRFTYANGGYVRSIRS